MSYIIREATYDDLNSVCNVENACFPPEEAASREAFETRLRTFPQRFLVAEEHGCVIGLINGCCTTAPYLDDCLYEKDCPHNLMHPWQTVFGLAVLPDHQHRGIATALMSSLIERCKQGGQIGVILTCKEEKIPFYQSFGFLCRGRSDSSHGGATWYDMILEF